MKIAMFGPARRVGLVVDDSVVDINAAYARLLADTTSHARPQAQADAAVPADLNAFIAEGRAALDGAQKALLHLADLGLNAEAIDGGPLRFALSDITLHAPIQGASRIFAALANFADHMQAAAANASAEDSQATLARLLAGGPKYFAKDHRSASADGDLLYYPSRTERLDYEAEVAVVIGRRGKNIPAEEATSYIYGYTLFNDWSIRDNVQLGPNFLYWKNFDGAATIGPWIVVDEIDDPQDIPIESRVNGEVRQSGNTSSMLHDFPSLISYLSTDQTIWPGDLIASGTPRGTAVDSSRQNADGSFPAELFVGPGDVVEISSVPIGRLRNEIAPTKE